MSMEFSCSDPGAVVRAANVRATLDAFKLMPAIGRRIVEKHDLRISDLRPDHFIRVQHWLNALKDIQTVVGPAKLRDVGRNVVESANIPMGEDTESILMNLDGIYYQNHRGDVGHYFSSRLPNRAIEVRCETPYPRNFEWGLIEGFCRYKATEGRRYSVEYINGPARALHTCTLIVRPLVG
ncbi:hypothetical protein [Pendulispora albinea]|uniref:Uncharacterized protein n=1 Tax=Pendulispora albinea TaxID=2741071 RepID=A0ABZ2M8J7_9BACT